MKILALDYDGVLVHSRYETFAVAYNIYQKKYGFKNLSKELLNKDNFERIDNELKDIEIRFTRLRPFCNHVCNFSSIMSALDEGREIKDRKGLDEYRKGVKEDPDFRNWFHEERLRLQEEEFNGFLKLSPPHQSVINDVKKLMKIFDKTFILTGNKKNLIRKVLLAYGMDFPIKDIFDAEFIALQKRKSKKVQIEHIMELTKAKPGEIVFVEDQLSYLESVMDTGVKLVMVDWGFDNEEDRIRAKERGISVVDKEEFYGKVCELIE